jgi:hypothetical protein
MMGNAYGLGPEKEVMGGLVYIKSDGGFPLLGNRRGSPGVSSYSFEELS